MSQAPTTRPSHRSLFDRPLPADYRDELRVLEADGRTLVPQASGSLLVFLVGGMRLALATKVTTAVAPVLHLARVPHRSGTVLLGLTAFRGEILPCCSFSALFGFDGTDQISATSGRTLILEETLSRRWAVLIEVVLGVYPDPGTYGVLPSRLGKQWLRGSVVIAGETCHVLDDEFFFRQMTLATA